MPTVRPSEMHAAASDPFYSRSASLLFAADPKQALAVFLSVSLTFSTLGLDGCKKEQPQSQQAQGQAARHYVCHSYAGSALSACRSDRALSR